MRIQGKEYRTIWFENNVVKIIDQTKLPHQFLIKELKTVNEAINAIKIMEVRGAPLIGGTAVPPIRGAPLTSIILIAFIASFTVLSSLIKNW